MKWMLVVMIFGSHPVKSDVIFDTLDKCLAAEEAVRAEQESRYNSWRAGAQGTGRLGEESFQKRRIGMDNRGICIPHAGPVTKLD